MNKSVFFRDITGFYSDEGSGTPLVFIHGFCEDGSVWDAFRKKFSGRFRVIVFDLPGYRNTPLTSEHLTIEWMADFVMAILDRESVTNPIIIGHSMGGYIMLALVEKYPSLPQKIGLFHSHCFADDEEKKQGRLKAIDFISKNGTAGFADELYNNLFGEKFLRENKAAVDKMKAAAGKYPAETVISGLRAMLERPDRSHVLQTCRQPVLFILGKEDKAIPYMKSLAQCGYPAIADVHILENAGHMGMIEEPEKTLGIVAEFANLKT